MPRNWLPVQRAIIPLVALALLIVFAFTRFLMTTDDPDEVAAVLNSAELVDDAGGDTTSESSNDSDDRPDRSSGAIPTPIGPTAGTEGAGPADSSTGAPEIVVDVDGPTDPSLDTVPDTNDPDGEDPVDQNPIDPESEGPEDTPNTTVPTDDGLPEDEPTDDPANEPGDDELGEDNKDGPPDDDVDDPDGLDPDEDNPDDAPPNTPPTVWLTWSGYTLGGLTGQTTSPVTFLAADPDGDPLTFSAIDLPPGLIIDPATGTVTGTFVGPCSCQVTIVVTDGRGGSGSVGFGWTVI